MEIFQKRTIETKIFFQPRYILPRFLGILTYFDSRLGDQFVPMENKLRMLNALKDVLKFMGPVHLSSVKHKVIATLNTVWTQTIKHRSIPNLVCDLWETFLKTIEIGSVGPMLEQVSANLLKILADPKCRDRVQALFKFLVVDNKSQLSAYFHRLNFLPEDELAEINEVIRRKNNVTPNTEFRQVLRGVMTSLENENVDVKAATLKKLLQLLTYNQGRMFSI